MNIAELVNSANKLFLGGDAEAAIREYRRLLGVRPDDPIIKENLALALISRGLFNEAEEALKDCPNSGSAHNLLGNIYFYKSDFLKAKLYYEKAVGLDPNCGDAWSNLGNVYFEFKEFNRAGDCCKRAVETNPGNSYWYSGLGKALLAQGKAESAVEAYKKALEINPGLEGVKRILCGIYEGLVRAKFLSNDYAGAYGLYKDCRKFYTEADLKNYPNLYRIGKLH